MKTRPFIGFSLGLALALTAPGSASATAAVDPAILGSADAVLKYCGHINPAGAAGYWKLKVSMFGKLSSATLAALEATAQYKNAFNVVHGWLVGAPQGWPRQSCLDLVSSTGTG